jgi:hypothetical protein
MEGKDVRATTKAYLRHVKHGMYYCGWNRWTSDPTLAVKFETPADAMWAARDEKMTQMEIVIYEGNPPVEKVVAIISSGNRSGGG